MDVAILRWPKEETLRAELCAGRQPRLLLVEPSGLPPVTADLCEDWVRLPATDSDIQARVAGLRLRCLVDSLSTPRPPSPLTLDRDGLLRNGEKWVALPPIDAALVRALIGSVGAVVSRAALQQAAWPTQKPSENTLDVHMTRLRRRLRQIDVSIRTVRSRGYVLIGSM
ncbi:MAG: DNA-binding response OmpR family regulator [Acidimicrobiales bacterium]|jgi:DNA-binding response OmpR family regulator